MNLIERSETENWILDFLAARAQIGAPEANAWHRQFLPFSGPIFTRMKAVFLSDFAPAYRLPFSEDLWARDGSNLLSRFFATADPSGANYSVLVPEEFRKAVPAAWRQRVRLCRVRETVREKNVLPERMILLPPLADDPSIAQLVNTCSAQTQGEPREWLIVSAGAAVSSEISRLRTLGPSVDLIDWEDLDVMTDLQGWGFLDCNDRSIVGESLLAHALWSKGATCVRRDSPTAFRFQEERREPLSPFHELIVGKSDTGFESG